VTAIPLPPPLTLYRGLDPAVAVPDLLKLIEDAIRNDPRTLQTRIGPSELGCACDRCLILMLAGRGPDEDAPWMPTIGHAVHDWIEGVIVRHLMTSGSDRYIPEGKVAVGEIAGELITGHSDVFDTWTGTVVDWKVIGTTTLRKVNKEGLSLTYRRQAHLYGKGWEDAGYKVTSVAVAGLPRNGFHVGAGFLHQEDYDRSIAEHALARANMFAAAIRFDGLDKVLESAPPHTGSEFSCPDEKAEATLARAGQSLKTITL
jgi:hypothetical protein